MIERIALGTVQFGLDYGINNHTGKPTTEMISKMLQLAFKMGIKTIDTAASYGASEKNLGLTESMDSMQIVTKIPSIPENCLNRKKWIENSFQESLRNLRVKSVYGLLLHDSQNLLKSDSVEIYDTLLEIREAGLVKKIGVSIYTPNEFEYLISNFDLDLVQAPFNVIDRRLEDEGWLDVLYDLNIEVHTRSSFLQGLLLMESNVRKKKFPQWLDLWEFWDSWLVGNSIKPLDACLSFSLKNQKVSKAVIGFDNINQLISLDNTKIDVGLEYPKQLESSDLNLINPVNWN